MESLKETTSRILENLANTPISQENLIKCENCEKEFDKTWNYLARRGCAVICKSCYEIVQQNEREKNIVNLMAKSGIPPKFHNIITDIKIDDYILSNRGLYLWGKSGTGKTVMACSIARRLIILGADVKFISSPKFIIDIQCAFRKDGEHVDDILSQNAHKSILIIDDIGAEKLTDFVKQIFYYIINEREQYIKKTIITSNFSLDELDRHIDSRISSRIAGMCDILELKGADRRIKSI